MVETLAVTSLTWDQVRAWRLERQALESPVPGGAMLELVSRLCGVHAQVMSSAELTIGVRTSDVTGDDVRRALWKER